MANNPFAPYDPPAFLSKPVRKRCADDADCRHYCCCGDHMDTHGHPMDCGHSPRSMHDYYCNAED